MAVRPRKGATSRETAGPSATTASAASSALGVGTTGRYLVLINQADSKTATRDFGDKAGIRLASISGMEVQSLNQGAVGSGEGLLFHDLGVAVIDALPDQVQSVHAAVASSSSLGIIEPERFVYATAGVDLSYLRGYRDAVDHLVNEVIGVDSGQSGTLVASADEATLSWGIQATNVANSRFTGKGVKVAVLDTGLDLTHPDFVGRAVQRQSFIQGVDTVQDGHGHGTHCAGIACGPLRPSRLPRFAVATGADLYVGKVLDDAGQGTDSAILAGLQWALACGCQIISMSLGGPVDVGQSYSAIFEQVAQRALAQQCLVVAAAGNTSRRPQSTSPVNHPANCPSIIAVAAVDQQLDVAWFSSAGLNPQGGQVDIAGPGVGIVSAWPTPTNYKVEDGTSMATPHVAGIAALIAEAQPTARGRGLQALLTQHTKRLNGSAVDIGSGLVQAP